jgi:hypothetical protein
MKHTQGVPVGYLICSIIQNVSYLVNEVNNFATQAGREHELTASYFCKNVKLIIPPGPKWELVLEHEEE